jgi:hypothetical protein
VTPLQMLIDAVGEDAAVSVRLWLVDIFDGHALEVDGKVISPSVEWLIGTLGFDGSGDA